MTQVPTEPNAAPAGYRPPPVDPRIDLSLDANEALRVPQPVLEALSAQPVDRMRRYPRAGDAERLIAEANGVDASRVLVTAGADDALGRAIASTLKAGSHAVRTDPTFEMISIYLRHAGIDTSSVPWGSGAFPLDPLSESVCERTRAVFLVTPNNPTGLAAAPDDLRRVSDRLEAATNGAGRLVVDLAYTEFAETDLTPVALALPNTIVVRTFSKAWGLAGLRLGYAIAEPQTIDQMRALGHPFAVSGPSLVALEAALKAGEDACGVPDLVRRIRIERAELADLVERTSSGTVTCTPSEANFVLARMEDAEGFSRSLASHGIAVRTWPNRTGPDRAGYEGCVRITLPGDAALFARLAGAVRQALEARDG